jgi:glycosyltransferase involved in cell wall biosynthesis
VREIIIVDDGSLDGSLEVAQHYASANPSIKVYTHENRMNKGVSATANYAFRQATGDYICWLGSDDIWEKCKVERQLKIMEQDKTLGLIYSRAAVIDGGGAEVGQVIGEGITAGVNQTSFLIKHNVIPCLTVMFRRACLDDAGPLDEGVLYSDWELWIRISTCWKITFTEDVLARYRVHGANVSAGVAADIDASRRLEMLISLKRKRADLSSVLLVSKHGSDIDRAVREASENLFGACLDGYYLTCQRGDLLEAVRHLLKAAKLRPMKLIRVRRLASLVKYALVGMARGQQAY